MTASANSPDDYDALLARAIETDDAAHVLLLLDPIVAFEQARLGANVWTFLKQFYALRDDPWAKTSLIGFKFMLFVALTHPKCPFEPRIRSLRMRTFINVVLKQLTVRLGKDIKLPEEYVRECISAYRLT